MGLDIRDLGAGLSYRRLAVLLRHPAPDSSFVRSMRGHDWTPLHFILAALYDLVAAFLSKGAAKPYPRPKTTSTKRAPIRGLAQLREFTEARREGRKWEARA